METGPVAEGIGTQEAMPFQETFLLCFNKTVTNVNEIHTSLEEGKSLSLGSTH